MTLLNALIENARNVVFDVGCVLLTFEPERYVPLLVPGELGRKLPWELLYGSKAWEQLDQGVISEEGVALDTARRYGDESLWRQILPAVQRFNELMRPMPATELIPRLHAAGKRVYVLSNYGRDGFARTADRFQAIFSQMDGMVISSHELICKPDPRIYRILLERYGLDPHETVFIDDRPVNIEGARAAGMQGIVYTGMDALLK